jgi:hypothetical protein
MDFRSVSAPPRKPGGSPQGFAARQGAGEDMIATAYHEAGHVVIARVLRIACGGATMFTRSRPGCGVSLADPWLILAAWADRKRYRSEDSAFVGRILATMAGREAEILFTGRCRRDDGDQSEISAMIGSLPVPCRNEAVRREDIVAYQDRLRRRTQALIRRHNWKIGRVANALLQRGSLRPDEIDRVIGPG